MKGWQHFSHEADIGVRGYGKTKAEAFEQAALALTAIITKPDQVMPCESISVDCSANDDEILLVDWLNEIIYQMATRHMLFSKFHVQLDHHHLHGRLSGEAIDRKRHQPAVEPKGATFTTLSVWQNDQGDWVAQTVVDV